MRGVITVCPSAYIQSTDIALLNGTYALTGNCSNAYMVRENAFISRSVATTEYLMQYADYYNYYNNQST